VRRVFEQGAYADRARRAEAAGLSPRERGLATALAYGTVQRRGTLDFVAAQLVDRDLGKLEAVVLAALRLGLFQLLYMQGIGDHAAVNETVELVKALSRGGAGLLNAVLRRGAREGPSILAALTDDTPENAAVAHSVPPWLARMWWEQLGEAEARALLRTVNVPAESALRVNTLVASVPEVTDRLPVDVRAAPGLAEGLVYEGAFDVFASPLWRTGAITAQSRSSMLVSRALAPRPGERVLDLCAAPGGKTTHLAALLENRGEILTVGRHAGRAKALAATCARMHADCVAVEIADAARRRAGGERFDRVLVDPPCSGLGTLQSRPDLRWRVTPSAIAEMAALQARIMAAGAAATRPGGGLVYSVCTISRAEGEELIDTFLREHADFAVDDSLDGELPLGREGAPGRGRLLPSGDGSDGFYLARLARKR